MPRFGGGVRAKVSFRADNALTLMMELDAQLRKHTKSHSCTLEMDVYFEWDMNYISVKLL